MCGVLRDCLNLKNGTTTITVNAINVNDIKDFDFIACNNTIPQTSLMKAGGEVCHTLEKVFF